MIDLRALDRPPLGFAACGNCAYREAGSAAICSACAAETIEAPPAEACEVCDRPRSPGELCANPVCHFPDRHFTRVHAISMREGQMKWAISRFKYDGKTGWRLIFGRILVGYLDAHPDLFIDYDAIIPSPTYMGPDAPRSFDHTRLIVEAAEIEDPLSWPFAYDLILKKAATERFATKGAVKSWRERKQIAEGPLREALRVPDPQAVAGRRILVFTDGFTIREVARCLLEAGAAEVSEVVLARQPFGG
ncbi:MAG: ComF family protein [Actinobacteria bacterium]|nr:ComF family protein [Actinomycetota bacterium]